MADNEYIVECRFRMKGYDDTIATHTKLVEDLLYDRLAYSYDNILEINIKRVADQ